MVIVPMGVSAKTDIDYEHVSVHIKVLKSNKMVVTETGKVKGDAQSELTRKVPLYFEIGDGRQRLAKITDVAGSATSFRSSKLGNAIYLTAKTGGMNQTYTINYTYDFSTIDRTGTQVRLPIVKYDNYRQIEQLDFDIEFEDLDTFDSFQWVLNGQSVADDLLTYQVENNHITGSFNGLLAESDFSIITEVPYDYFINDHNNYNTIGITFFLFTFAIFIITFGLYLCAKRKIRRAPVFREPPAGLSPSEIGLLYKGEAGDKDIIAYIVSFAVRGLLKIETIVSEDGKKETFRLVKLKEINSDDEIENYIFYQIFDNRDKEIIDEFKGRFYQKLAYAKKQLDIRTLEDKVYEKKSCTLLYLIYGFDFLVFLALQLCFFQSILGSNFDAIVCTLFAFFATLSLLFTINHDLPLLKKISYIIIFVPILIMVAYSFMNLRYNWFYVVCLFLIFIMLFLGKEIQRRFQNHSYIVRKVEGFRRYLKKYTPKYQEIFYAYLPYAYALGVSKEWVKNSKGLDVEEPVWIDGYKVWSPNEFSKIFEYRMEIIGKVLASMPATKKHTILKRKPRKKAEAKVSKSKKFVEETKLVEETLKKEKPVKKTQKKKATKKIVKRSRKKKEEE